MAFCFGALQRILCPVFPTSGHTTAICKTTTACEKRTSYVEKYLSAVRFPYFGAYRLSRHNFNLAEAYSSNLGFLLWCLVRFSAFFARFSLLRGTPRQSAKRRQPAKNVEKYPSAVRFPYFGAYRLSRLSANCEYLCNLRNGK